MRREPATGKRKYAVRETGPLPGGECGALGQDTIIGPAGEQFNAAIPACPESFFVFKRIPVALRLRE
jgi:hypothetical protein